MANSLAVKYRPQTFDECLEQSVVIKILKQQLEAHKISNCYLFCGPSGDGKTTLSRILANCINNYQGSPIEIDAASNSGVENVRNIIDSARERALDCDYKVFIIDECHSLSNQAWQAFLKCIEEPPEYTIFMFCTTNPEKIPPTINNRLMRFNLTRVSSQAIYQRLVYICKQEGFTNYEEACDYIAKLSNGGVRDAICYLEKCANYSKDLSIENVLSCLGNFSYDALFDLTASLLNNDEGSLISAIEGYYSEGKDLKLFIETYLDFAMDLVKYCLFKDMSLLKIPSHLESRCAGYSNIPDSVNYSNKLVDTLLNIKTAIKNDVNNKNTIIIMLLRFCSSMRVLR